MNTQKKIRKLSAALLATTMAASSFSHFSTLVFAQDMTRTLSKEQFATVEELKSFNTISNDDIPAAKVYFGENNQQWWIVGSQKNDGLTLFAASPLAKQEIFELNSTTYKPYDSSWNCTYVVGDAPSEVYPNHYGASPIRKILKTLESSCFTQEEQKLINKTNIHVNGQDNTVYTVEDKLYLAFGETDYTNYVDNKYITIGEVGDQADLNSGLRIDLDYWATDDFWLRGPGSSGYAVKATTFPSGVNPPVKHKIVGEYSAEHGLAIVPGFEFNLSSVLFGSAAPVASTEGDLTLQDTSIDGAFTLRYDASERGENLGAAKVSYDKKKVILTDVPSDTYLVVQNNSGAWAKKIKNETSFTPSEVDQSLTSFENCKVWLEKTDETNRMTYATLARESQGYNINVIGNNSLKITNGVQEIVPNNAIADINVEVANGYYLPEDYMNSLQTGSWNGLSATKTDHGFTISGKPTDDVNIQLPAATPKPVSGSGGGGSTQKLSRVYRAYNPNNGEHLYTLDEKEYKHVTSIGWQAEDVAFMAEEEKSGQPLYRVYNPNSGLHHYTLNEDEKNTLVSLGWHDEKVAWYTSKKPQSAPVYRVYNPNDGNHHYTMNKQEKDILVSLGWHDEEIAFRTAPIEK